jgi:hypothetical protein
MYHPVGILLKRRKEEKRKIDEAVLLAVHNQS